MARTKNFDEDKVLEAAMLLFWEKGYSATSMKELEQVMQLNPTSIYNTFGSKRELFQKALRLYMNSALSGFIDAITNARSLPIALQNVLNEVIRLHYNPGHPGGCMVMLSILENEQHDEETRAMLNSALPLLRDTLVKRFKQAQAAGEISTEMDSKDFGNHVTALISGMITMAKSGFSKNELKHLIQSSSDCLLQQCGI
ncbi:TetR family transcriptional regulator [Thiogranum longum]|uniref:TetR family transcriptional regulator n=1 Tax=Thiogranum longum TaxID=1537524 RepID=A0A4R1H9I0_9GAMM|nr:TetR/AcrR family transcriptional regulator [Thiogranum longum]TCK18547.1 TetR family transcriptional regulator [Thiogranum longum]